MTDLPCEVENRDTGWEEEEETKESERNIQRENLTTSHRNLNFFFLNLAKHRKFIGFKEQGKTQIYISNYYFHSPGSKTLLHFQNAFLKVNQFNFF